MLEMKRLGPKEVDSKNLLDKLKFQRENTKKTTLKAKVKMIASFERMY